MSELDGLTRHLDKLFDPSIDQWTAQQAHQILAYPQAHIWALEQAGVLQQDKNFSGVLYRVVQPKPPHEHTWAAIRVAGGMVDIACTCGANGSVPNRLPLDFPTNWPPT